MLLERSLSARWKYISRYIWISGYQVEVYISIYLNIRISSGSIYPDIYYQDIYYQDISAYICTYLHQDISGYIQIYLIIWICSFDKCKVSAARHLGRGHDKTSQSVGGDVTPKFAYGQNSHKVNN